MMQYESPAINFAPEAEIRSKAEQRRTAEIMELLGPILNRWAVRFRRRKPIVFYAAQYIPAPAGVNRQGEPGNG
jgi:hypothetical protein